ncbi:MAG: AprI/Inh family metalloprotease inhibitor [Rhodobacteraceae bacterium]|nr:AprI/Inh family metalloprotease inhibitor [Paracoccaceae bacterium]
MRQQTALLLVLSSVLVLAGCQRMSGSRNLAAPLPATPTTAVAQTELQPLDPLADPAAGQTSLAGGQTNLAVAEPAGAISVTRSDLAGGWKISSAGDNCMAFMALTAWSGGYRANTRGCGSPLLSSIAAWDLNGKQVILKDGSGNVIAQLFATAGQQFVGQSVTGTQISLFR